MTSTNDFSKMPQLVESLGHITQDEVDDHLKQIDTILQATAPGTKDVSFDVQVLSQSLAVRAQAGLFPPIIPPQGSKVRGSALLASVPWAPASAPPQLTGQDFSFMLTDWTGFNDVLFTRLEREGILINRDMENHYKLIKEMEGILPIAAPGARGISLGTPAQSFASSANQPPATIFDSITPSKCPSAPGLAPSVPGPSASASAPPASIQDSKSTEFDDFTSMLDKDGFPTDLNRVLKNRFTKGMGGHGTW